MIEKTVKKNRMAVMSDLKELRRKTIGFIQSSWLVPAIEEKFEVLSYEESLEKAFADKAENIKANPSLIRLAGQSGSGKSTQLLPAAAALFDSKGIAPVHIAVREFAPYHPHYNEIRETYGEGMLRENTNNFALMLSFLVAEKLILNKMPVIFEITLLDEAFENYFAALAESNGYRSEYHILAVSKETSDAWIEERSQSSAHEKSRKVLASSKNYFYDSLPKALRALAETVPEGRCVIWNGYDERPVYIGKMQDGKLLETLEVCRNGEMKPHDEEALRQAKIEWFKRNALK